VCDCDYEKSGRRKGTTKGDRKTRMKLKYRRMQA